MKVPCEWLKEYCAPDVSLSELEQLLTISGTKVEAIHHHGVNGLENFVVGRVETCEQHPDADRLKVCTVDVGDGAPSQIVCGAPMLQPARPSVSRSLGPSCPTDQAQEGQKLRGVESNG